MANSKASIFLSPDIFSISDEASITDFFRVGICKTLNSGSKFSMKKVHNISIWVDEGWNGRRLRVCTSLPKILAERVTGESDESVSNAVGLASSSSDTSTSVSRNPSTCHTPRVSRPTLRHSLSATRSTYFMGETLPESTANVFVERVFRHRGTDFSGNHGFRG